MILFGQLPNTVKELYALHVHMISSGVFPQTVAGVGGETKTKTQTPFNLGPGSTSTSSKRGTKIRRSSNCKNETTSKKQGHSQSERSGVYPKEEVSVCHSATVATEHSLSPATGNFHPATQVNYCFI